MIAAETHGRPLVALCRVVGRPALGGAAALGLALSATWCDPVAAVGLGAVTQQSSLGQSLRVVVPLILAPGEDASAECFKLASSDQDGDGVPQIAFGRVSLERTSAGAELVITSGRAVNDPIVRVTVQAGCDTAVRREYLLLMDPAPIDTAQVAADSGTRSEAAVAPPLPTPPQAVATPPSRGARGRARSDSGSVSSGTGDAARTAPKPPAAKAPAAKPRAAARPAPNRPPRVAAADRPRFSVSSGGPPVLAGATAPALTDAQSAQAQRELADSIEAETVVLRQRIVELSAMVERMQQEVQANELAQRAAEEAAKATPLAKATAWWNANWGLLCTIIIVPLVLAAAILWRRRRKAAEVSDWQASGVASIRPDAAPNTVAPHPAAIDIAIPAPASTVTEVLSTAGAGQPAPKKAARRAPAARDGANALAVSELLHVTEEARVYVALGHPERAIDVLNNHIRQVPRSMPAAWLMLLDLYHSSGRRQEFRRLAEEFHLHCNVQAPLWEGFGGDDANEGGLETFPHILRQVVDMWRRPECRTYLEGLLYDNREGRRIGFPLAAYGDILLLLQVLDAPAAIDIDSDLAGAGRLDSKPPGPPRAAPKAPASPGERPASEPLTLELDLDQAARDRDKKPSR